MRINRAITFFSCRFWPKAASCAGLVALADFFFYGCVPGSILGLFALLLLVAIGLHNPRITSSGTGVALYAAGGGLTLALVNAPGWLPALLLVVLAIVLANLPSRPLRDARDLPRQIVWTLLGKAGIYATVAVLCRIHKRLRLPHAGPERLPNRFVVRWVLPLTLSGVFIWLFAEANPLIGGAFDYMHWHIDWTAPLKLLSPLRWLFWGIIGWFCWALIRPRMRTPLKAPAKKSLRAAPSHAWLNPQSIFTSLVLFNTLFAIQNGLDVIFLWSGADLPHGLTYARYAHQGAYPLMITALLAAGFVLVALKPGMANDGMKTIRLLVYAWVGQNVFLVTSCALRMLRYIEAYGLTEQRVIVLIWTGLVAAGLILIVVRTLTSRSNRWLVNVNAMVLAGTLYICCFVNFPGTISQYNVKHCREIAGNGPALDMSYLMWEGGVDAIPALIWFQKRISDDGNPLAARSGARAILETREVELTQDLRDWRSWSLRKYRLAGFTRENDAAAAN